MSEGDEFPRGVWGHAPGIFEMNVRCNLVHFETILRNVTMCALTSSHLDDFSHIVYCTDDNIFWGEAEHFWGEASTPQIP